MAKIEGTGESMKEGFGGRGVKKRPKHSPTLLASSITKVPTDWSGIGPAGPTSQRPRSQCNGIWALAMCRQHGLGTCVHLPQTSLNSYCSGNAGRCMAVHKRVSATTEGFHLPGISMEILQ